jgi:fatty acid-binding protein DegV
MAIKLHVVAVEATDEVDDLIFTVKCFDSESAELELKQTVHNAASWAELSADVARAIEMLKLDADSKTPNVEVTGKPPRGAAGAK